jgi:hypothetical protein
MTISEEILTQRERVVRAHMEAENALDMGVALDTFGAPALRDHRHLRRL